MASVGPNSFGTLANNDLNDPGVAILWTDPTNATSSNDIYATVILNGALEPNYSQYLQGTNPSFSIPAGSTIDGIVLEVEKKSSGDTAKGFLVDSNVQITLDGGVSFSATNLADTVTHWSTTESYITYGSSTELWGLTPSVSDVNGTGFGGGIVVVAGGALPFVSRTASVDHMRVTVYYTEASGVSQIQATLLFMGVG